MTPESLQQWRAFCEWLDQQPYKSAYPSAVPEQWRPLVYVGGNAKGVAARLARHELKLIFYWEGWGWRLRKYWKLRLEELESAQSEVVQTRAS